LRESAKQSNRVGIDAELSSNAVEGKRQYSGDRE
jgi:hypothetical protein